MSLPEVALRSLRPRLELSDLSRSGEVAELWWRLEGLDVRSESELAPPAAAEDEGMRLDGLGNGIAGKSRDVLERLTTLTSAAMHKELWSIN